MSTLEPLVLSTVLHEMTEELWGLKHWKAEGWGVSLLFFKDKLLLFSRQCRAMLPKQALNSWVLQAGVTTPNQSFFNLKWILNCEKTALAQRNYPLLYDFICHLLFLGNLYRLREHKGPVHLFFYHHWGRKYCYFQSCLPNTMTVNT